VRVWEEVKHASKESPETKNAPKKSQSKLPPIKPGTVLWEFETGGRVSSCLAIEPDGTVYVESKDRKLYAIKTDSKGLAKSPWPMRGQNARQTGRVMKK